MKYWIPHTLDTTREAQQAGCVAHDELRRVIEQHFPHPVMLEFSRRSVKTNGELWAWEGEVNHWLEQHVQNFGGQRMSYRKGTFVREPLDVDTEWMWTLISGDTYGFRHASHALLFKLTWA